MADISKIKLPSGSTYDIVDKKSGFVTTDEKVSTAAVTSGTTYYPTVGTNTTNAETKYYDSKGLRYTSTQGNSNQSGSAVLTLGQSANAGSANGRYGTLEIYSELGKKASIYPQATLNSDRTYALPNKSGTVALTSDIPTVPTKVSDLTNDSGFVTTDEKLQVSNISDNTSYNFVCMTSVGTIPRTSTALLTDELKIKKDTTNSVTNLLVGYEQRGQIKLGYQTGGNQYTTTLTTSHTNTSRTLTLPDATGTVALTSDITDEKVKTNSISNDTVYYPIVGTATSSATTKYYDASGLKYSYISSSQTAALMIGNETNISSNGKKGILRLGGSTQFKGVIDPGAPTADRTYTLPDATGTVALTSDVGGKVDKTCTYTNIDGNSGTQTIYNGTYTEDEGTENEYTYNYLALQDVGQYTDTENNTTLDYDSGASFGSGNGHIWASADDGSIADYSTLRVYSDGITMEVSHRYNNSTSTINMGVRNYINDSYAFISADTLKLGKGTYRHSIDCSSPTANRTLTLPDKTGTIALISDIPTDRTKVQIVRW